MATGTIDLAMTLGIPIENRACIDFWNPRMTGGAFGFIHPGNPRACGNRVSDIVHIAMTRRTIAVSSRMSFAAIAGGLLPWMAIVTGSAP